MFPPPTTEMATGFSDVFSRPSDVAIFSSMRWALDPLSRNAKILEEPIWRVCIIWKESSSFSGIILPEDGATLAPDDESMHGALQTVPGFCF